MRNLFLGLAAALAISIPVAAQAQSYDPFPANPQCTIVEYICYTQYNGQEFAMTIPSGYSGRYILGITQVGSNHLVFMFDQKNDETAAWMVLGVGDRVQAAEGNLDLLIEVVDETVDMLGKLRYPN